MEFLKKPLSIDVVVYHKPCNDGEAAAAVFYSVFRNVKMIGLHPKDNDKFTEEMYATFDNKTVVFVDISFSLNVLEEISRRAKQLHVLDHHITNKSILEEAKRICKPGSFDYVFDLDKSGVVLAWEYVQGTKPIPLAFHYIGLFDIFKHKDNEDACSFIAAFSKPTTWDGWLQYINDSLTQQIVAEGRVVKKFNTNILNTLMEKVQTTSWRSYLVSIVNVPYPFTSELGDMMCQKYPEKTVAIIWNKQCIGDYSCSFRSHSEKGPNVALICEEFGGGGHEHAAAIRTTVPPFEIFTDNKEFV